jgi:radical SAM/Cys-rich protein
MRQAPATDQGNFGAALAAHGYGALRRRAPTALQVNVGARCNQACHHCHVDAGPTRTEVMPEAVADRVLELLRQNPGIEVLDVTGGAPELAPCFRRLVAGARALERRVIDRCNLTILLEPGQEDLAPFLAAHGVEIVASLPCWGPDNVDAQRGQGAFEKSIRALRGLNALGYGRPGASLRLDLVYNPLGPSLPPPQAALERDYRRQLAERFGIAFDHLRTITNMPISRFAATLARRGEAAGYMSLLVHHFNPATVPELMCRSLVSVGWDGRLYDCDFNQMLALPLGGRAVATVWDVDDLGALDGAPIGTGPHCFGCTAGAGSGCGGALA